VSVIFIKIMQILSERLFYPMVVRNLRLLNLVDRNDAVCEIVAEKIMEVGATGASDPVAISEIAVRQLRGEYHCAKKTGSAEPRREFVTTLRRYILEIRKGIRL
jgi:hypothetical protein